MCERKGTVEDALYLALDFSSMNQFKWALSQKTTNISGLLIQKNKFSYFSTKTYVVSTQNMC